MPAGGGEGEEADVPGGIPPEFQALLPLFCLDGWTAWSGGDSNPENYIQSPGHNVAATLLEDVRLRQE